MPNLYSLGKPHIPFTQRPKEFFVLNTVEKEHIKTKRGPRNRLIYAILLKFFECEGQFPDLQITVDRTIKEFLAKQLDISFEDVELSERTLHRFYASIRTFFGYKKMTTQNKEDLAEYLKKDVLPQAPSDKQLFEAMVQFCRKNKLELFAKKEMDRFLASIQNTFENKLFKEISELLSDETKQKLDLLLEEKPAEIVTETPVTQEQEVELASSENLDAESTETQSKTSKKKEKLPEKEYVFALVLQLGV